MYFEKVEVFLFSINLIWIIEYLLVSNFVIILIVLLVKVDNWLSGIKIGVCFCDFNEEYVKCMFNG